MARKLASDRALFAVTVALLGIGLLMVWSASSALAQERHGSAYYFLVRQALWAGLGLLAMFLAIRLDYRRLRERHVVFGLLGAATALLILVLFLPTVNETHRWIRLGPLSFQPAELAKIALILFLAYYLERKAGRIHEFLGTVVPALLIVGWFAFLVFIQPDLGSAATLVLIAGVMLFLAGVRLRYFVALLTLALPVLFYAVSSAGYRRDRIEAFINPWSDARGSGYQIIQSLIAVGTGGLGGVGLMEGRQKLFYLPYPHSDFIFAVLGEELGLLGALAVVGGFVLLLWRGIRAAAHAPDAFSRYLAAGLTLEIVVQAFINVSVVLGLLPTKGIPLPFISTGGSSLLITLISVGLVLNVSQHAD
jgi:cell division protein FtsW